MEKFLEFFHQSLDNQYTHYNPPEVVVEVVEVVEVVAVVVEVVVEQKEEEVVEVEQKD
jgi:hypothetical protein